MKPDSSYIVHKSVTLLSPERVDPRTLSVAFSALQLYIDRAASKYYFQDLLLKGSSCLFS
jgi:hypothetical protein